MNAAARDYQQGSLFHGNLARVVFSKKVIGIIFLLVMTLFSALSVVYVKNYERRLFSELQFSQQAAQKLHVEWGQLLLEQSTWATPARVQSIAQDRFDMKLPNLSSIYMVKL